MNELLVLTCTHTHPFNGPTAYMPVQKITYRFRVELMWSILEYVRDTLSIGKSHETKSSAQHQNAHSFDEITVLILQEAICHSIGQS